MKIYVLSKGRPEKQRTADALIDAGVKFTTVLTKGDPTRGQYLELDRGGDFLTLSVPNLMDKRQRIFSAAKGPILMLDDDLTFFARKRDGHFERAEAKDLRKMVAWFAKVLKKHAHAGLVDKFMCTYQPRGVKLMGRYNQALGYNPKLAARAWNRRQKNGGAIVAEFDLELNQEHDMHMKLLALGLPPIISCEFSKDGKYYAKGGLSGFRTPAKERRVFKELARRYPAFVTLVDTEHAIGGIAARFNWRAATKAGALE